MQHLIGVSAKRFDWAQQYDTGATRDYFSPHFAIDGEEVEGAGAHLGIDTHFSHLLIHLVLESCIQS
jgi:hypothetical protein